MQRLLLASGLATLAGADPASDAFVHLFEWSWSDIAQECEDWLGPKGFKAVQVSPPTEHIQGQQWWTRYQPVSYNLTSRSGNEQGFREMVQRCKKAGVDVIADAVVNHVAAGSGTGIAGSPYGNRKTVLYNPEDFHHNSGDLSDNCAVNNYADKFNVQYCDLEGLPDLCTSCPNVQRAVGQYLTTLLQMPEDHIKLSEALGSLEHILHRPHPKAPDPRLLRVANDDREGFMSVGTSGWHVDGVMLQAPFAAQTMHHLHAIPGGDTLFLGMKELYHSMDEDLRELCDRLWFVSGVGDDLQQGEGQMSLLPLVYDHPFRGDKTMCFHLGQTYCLGFIEEVPLDVVMEMFANVMTRGDGLLKGARAQLQRILAGPENNCPSQFRFLPALPVQESLQKAIDGMDPTLRAQAITKVEWERGDLALIDNMALAHLPAPGTQTLPLVSGLRVFHRTTMTNPSAVPRNLRGASAVLLAGPRKDGPTSDEAVQDPDAMRDILRAVMAATPINVDELGGDQRGGDLQMPKNIPARDEALRALEETQQPLDLLKVVDAELEAADGQSREIFGKTLKKLLREYHPDRNQSRTKQAVPIFRYLWRLHKEQGRAASAMAPTKGRVVDRLRQKASKITVGDVVG